MNVSACHRNAPEAGAIENEAFMPREIMREREIKANGAVMATEIKLFLKSARYRRNQVSSSIIKE
jgi:hypothetical protein